MLRFRALSRAIRRTMCMLTVSMSFIYKKISWKLNIISNFILKCVWLDCRALALILILFQFTLTLTHTLHCSQCYLNRYLTKYVKHILTRHLALELNTHCMQLNCVFHKYIQSINTPSKSQFNGFISWLWKWITFPLQLLLHRHT